MVSLGLIYGFFRVHLGFLIRHFATLHYATLGYTILKAPLPPPLQLWLQMQLQLQLRLQLHYHYIYNYNWIHQLLVRRPLEPIQKAQLQPPFGPSVDSLRHLCITTIHFSYSFPSLRLPPSPCAVLLVYMWVRPVRVCVYTPFLNGAWCLGS